MSSSRKVKALIGYFSDKLQVMPTSLEEIEALKKQWLLVEMSSSATFYDLILEISIEKNKLIRENNFEMAARQRDKERKLIESYFDLPTADLREISSITTKNELICLYFYNLPAKRERQKLDYNI